MRMNNRGPADVRRVFSGKDGAVFDEDGNLLATVDSWQAQINFQNATYQPLGDTQSHRHLTAYEVTLTMSECIIESSKFIRDMYETMSTGVPVWWTFQGHIQGWDGSYERVIFRDCVPDGQIDLQNLTAGDLWKRTWSLFVNAPPELQNILSYEQNERD